MPAFQFTKMLRNALARALVEKPETRHCRVIYSQIILRHLKPKLVNLFYQIKMISHRGHPMIRNHCEDCFRINLARRPKDLAQGLVIPVETLLNSLWFVTVHVQEHISRSGRENRTVLPYFECPALPAAEFQRPSNDDRSRRGRERPLQPFGRRSKVLR